MPILSKDGFTLALGSAIGRAIGNNGAELKQRPQQELEPLALGTVVRVKMQNAPSETGTVYEIRDGYRLGRPVKKYLVKLDGGGYTEKHLTDVEAL